jgi:hypothetical protein
VRTARKLRTSLRRSGLIRVVHSQTLDTASVPENYRNAGRLPSRI